MKKVILKCQLSSGDKFEKKLSDIDLDFSPIYWQHDRVYVPRNYKRGMNLPRLIVRTNMKAVDVSPEYLLILKRHIEDSGIDVVEETDIKDNQGNALKLIAFFAPEQWLSLTPEDKIVPLIKLMENDFNGVKSAEAQIIDIEIIS